MLKHTIKLPHRQRQNVYGVEVYQRNGAVAVVLSEVRENRHGVSITNAVEMVATDVVHGLIEQGVVENPEAVCWIEHYPGDGVPRERAAERGTWDNVRLRWHRGARRYDSPAWSPCAGRHIAPDFTGWRKVL